jgi:hypothetical protein
MPDWSLVLFPQYEIVNSWIQGPKGHRGAFLKALYDLIFAASASLAAGITPGHRPYEQRSTKGNVMLFRGQRAHQRHIQPSPSFIRGNGCWTGNFRPVDAEFDRRGIVVNPTLIFSELG